MGKLLRRWLIPAALVLVLLAVLATAGLRAYGRDSAVTTPFFSGKRVMVLVPHQDDELNLAGGILEQYVRAGSEVLLVFATNGDYNGLAELRSREALAVADSVGIPAEQVYYLGYGNQWEPQVQEGLERRHIYFSVDGDAVWTSHFGARQTYGTSVQPCWRDSAYTRNNFLGDLTALILQERPDVIFCGDYDAHHDHMALDLFFEEAMGNILKQEADYHPAVYKGLCYGTAWYAEADFVGAENLHASRRPAWEHWDRLGISYCWEDRVRLPMGEENRSRLLSRTALYRSVGLYRSQHGHRFAEAMLNGDKVFFQRRTDSLLYRAVFSDGGETVTVWNDFKLKDSEEFSALINTGVRYGDAITVTLEAPAALDQLWLYDAPSAEDNILGGYVSFDDGSRVDFGPLEPGGAATRITFPERTVGAFELHFTRTEGASPGLTEIEAYCGGGAAEGAAQLLLAVDENDDIAYDHWISHGEEAEFSLYAYPAGSVSGFEDVEVTMKGSLGCAWSVEQGKLRVRCPLGGRAEFTISGPEGVETTFTVSNPPAFLRTLLLHIQQQDRDRAIAADDRLCQELNG